MELKETLKRKIIFIQGKGGVGKSTFAHGVAHALARKGARTLLVVIEDPLLPPGKIENLGGKLDRVNTEPGSAFEEYASLKVGSAILAKIFTQNKIMRYLVQAAPGIKELTVMGKIWHERKNYQHVIVDMPATGHGITLFQSIENWRRLFAGSPIEKDSKAMTETFSDPATTGHCIVALPEEMPMIEALELEENLSRLHPSTQSSFVLNRLFPDEGITSVDPDQEKKPFAETLERHLQFRIGMEKKNQALWAGKTFAQIPYFGAEATASENRADILIRQMSEHLERLR